MNDNFARALDSQYGATDAVNPNGISILVKFHQANLNCMALSHSVVIPHITYFVNK